MNVVTALCLAGMIAVVVTIITKICLFKRGDRLRYLQGFKKGKFALIYLMTFPLYLIGTLYSGLSVGNALLQSVSSCIELVVLKYDYSNVAALMADNQFYRVTMYICFVLVAVNALVFTLTLFGRSLSNLFHRLQTVKLSKKVFVIVGFNEETKNVITSIASEGGKVILFAEDGDDVADFCYINKTAYFKFSKENNVGEALTKLFNNFDDKSVKVIVSTGEDRQNLIYIEQLSEVICKLDLKDCLIDEDRGVKAYVFGEPENISAFMHFVEKTNGCVHYLNKYHLVAMDFVDKYPLTQFMDERHIDFHTATLRDSVENNVVMIGFGRTNQQIFLTSVANNQFLTLREGKPCPKPVNYWIYDRKNSQNDKNLNHNYFRYSKEIDIQAENAKVGKDRVYLELPEKPANEGFFELDVNDMTFYDSVKEHLTVEEGKIPFNYVIIAFGKDMENLDFAEKIVTKLKEWDILHCTKVFVKIRDKALNDDVIKKEFLDGNLITFGNESEVVYNLEQIVGEKQERMALARHLRYAVDTATEKGVQSEDIDKVKISALKQWYSYEQPRRESNVYGCLSVRMKLHLLGFDYKAADSTDENARAEFLEKYQKGDPIIYDDANAKFKHIVHTNNFVEGSIRQRYAVQEHQRWNAYMIICGIVPSTIAQIENGDHKRLDLRRHGNITTLDGLKEFREITARTLGKTEEETDVIRYDYQVMDDLVWLLEGNGQKIVKR